MKKLSFFLILSIFIFSCKKEGCTNPKAENYNSEADEDDGSCTLGHEGTYFVKDSIFYENEFFENKTYNLKVEYLSTTDSIVIRSMPGVSVVKDLKVLITGNSLNIPLQPFDPNAEASGSGTFDFGIMNFELNYGVVRHSCKATKN